MSTNNGEYVDRDEFYQKIDELMKSKLAPNTFLVSREKYNNMISQVKLAKTVNYRKTPADFRRIKRFEIVDTPQGERLYMSRKPGETEQQVYVPVDEIYDIIREYHLKLNHGGRTRMMVELKKKYKNVTAQSVLIYLSLCKDCKSKKRRMIRTNSSNDNATFEEDLGSEDVSFEGMEEDDPLDSELQDSLEIVRDVGVSQSMQNKSFPELYSRGQVDILEVTADANEEYKYLLVYRNLVNKFIHLKPMRATSVDDTTDALLEIFLTFGAPNILQSKNGMPVTKPICRRITTVCPDIKIVAGEANISERDFKGKSNADILRMLSEYLNLNKKSNWSKGLKFVQHSLNTTFHQVMCRTPSELIFGVNPRKGLASIMPLDEYECLITEDDLTQALEQNEQGQRSPKRLKLEASLILPCNFIKKEMDSVADLDDFETDD